MKRELFKDRNLPVSKVKIIVNNHTSSETIRQHLPSWRIMITSPMATESISTLPKRSLKVYSCSIMKVLTYGVTASLQSLSLFLQLHFTLLLTDRRWRDRLTNITMICKKELIIICMPLTIFLLSFNMIK